MRRRLLGQMTVCFLLGIFYDHIPLALWLIASGALFGYFLWSITKPRIARWRRIFYLALWTLFFILGLWRGIGQTSYEKSISPLLFATGEVTFQGKLYKKEETSSKTLYYFKEVILIYDGETYSCRHVLFYPTSDEIPIDSIIVGTATIAQFDTATNDGSYDAKEYYASSDLYFYLQEKEITMAKEPRLLWKESLYQLRKRLVAVFATYLPGEESSILSTMLLGDKSTLEKETKDLFRLSGLSHMLVISGLHISILGMGIYKVLRKLRLSFVTSSVISFSILFLFLVMIGMGNSAIRASGMFAVTLVAQIFGKGYDSISAICLMFVAMLAASPYLISNSSVLLSFTAVFCAVTFAKKLNERFPYPGVTGLGITIGMLPALAYYFYEVPLYSVLLNFVLLPFMSVLLFLGIVGGIFGLFGIWLAKPVFLIVHYILYIYEWAAGTSLKLPGARQIIGEPKLYQILIFYVLLYLALYIIQKRWIIPILLTAAVAILCIHKYSGFCIDFLDVEQGDGIYIQSEEGEHFFIDGGSTTSSSVGTYTILPFLKCHGIRQIDYWFVSHPDSDHISGLLECLESGYQIDTLVFSKYVVRDENFEELYAVAQESGCEFVFLDAEDELHTKSLCFTCLYPWSDGDDVNAQSMALRLDTTSGLSAFFGGDLSIEEEEQLIGKVGEVTVFKALHHGSNGSNATALLEELSPEVIVVSCALINSYGHPGEEAVARMKEVCDDIYYTMNQGQVHIRVKKRQLNIVTKVESLAQD